MKNKGIPTALLAVALGFVFFAFDPSTDGLFPKCPFLLLTGLKCPGCGSQRAVHCLLHFDFAQAFSYNALLVLSLPLIALLGYAEINRKRKPDFYRRIHRPAFILTYLAIVIVWTIARNLYDIHGSFI